MWSKIYLANQIRYQNIYIGKSLCLLCTVHASTLPVKFCSMTISVGCNVQELLMQHFILWSFKHETLNGNQWYIFLYLKVKRLTAFCLFAPSPLSRRAPLEPFSLPFSLIQQHHYVLYLLFQPQ